MRDGIAREAVPVSRSLAEIRGSVNQALRRLERLEQELLAERTSRIDDLGILVDLISSGWNGVDARLGRLERGLENPPAPFTARTRKRRTYEVASTTAQTVAHPATVTSSGTSSTRSVSGSSPRPRRCSRSR